MSIFGRVAGLESLPPGPSVHLKSRWQAALLFGQMYAEISRLRFVTDGFLDIVEGVLPARFISV